MGYKNILKIFPFTMFGTLTKKVEKWLNQKWLNKILGFK